MITYAPRMAWYVSLILIVASVFVLPLASFPIMGPAPLEALGSYFPMSLTCVIFNRFLIKYINYKESIFGIEIEKIYKIIIFSGMILIILVVISHYSGLLVWGILLVLSGVDMMLTARECKAILKVKDTKPPSPFMRRYVPRMANYVGVVMVISGVSMMPFPDTGLALVGVTLMNVAMIYLALSMSWVFCRSFLLRQLVLPQTVFGIEVEKCGYLMFMAGFAILVFCYFLFYRPLLIFGLFIYFLAMEWILSVRENREVAGMESEVAL